MKRGVVVPVLLSLVLIFSLAFVSAGFFSDLFNKNKITGNVVINSTTPRVAFWCGKVNQHTENGVWKTDSDGVSGCDVNKLNYCRKFYGQGIIGFKEYANETITSWRSGGNTGGPYTSIRQSYGCIAGCTAETNAAFCSRLGKNCGSVAGTDNCGKSRTVSCGVCSSGYVCQTSGSCVKNTTATCIPATCASLGRTCGSWSDNCGSVLNCGICATGQTCSNGKCMPQNNTNYNCYDSDGGNYPYIQGGIYNVNNQLLFSDKCVVQNSSTTNLLREGVCIGSNYTINEYICPNGCANNSCVPICGDSDNGINIYKKGVVTSTNLATGIIVNNTDVCYSSSAVSEYYCQIINGRLLSGLILNSCVNGCSDGECIQCMNSSQCTSTEKCFNGKCLASPSCVDSDNGINYYTKGTLTYIYGGLSLIPNDKSVVNDYCSGNSINEIYCFYDGEGIAHLGWKGIVCKYGCYNGACKKLFGIFE